jgi:hypothetical protein
VEIKKIKHGREYYLLCISQGRKSKDEAIRESHEKKFLSDLEKLQKRIENGKIKDTS